MTTAALDKTTHNLRQIEIFTYWLPLAFSWLMMLGLTPLLQGVLSRLPNPEISIAAYGLIFSIGTVLEAPIVPLLSTSTALSRSRQSVQQLQRFTFILSAFTVTCQALFSLTPLYYTVVVPLINIPAELVEPVRVGMSLMIPWSAFVGLRRNMQGILIRNDLTKHISTGTFLRIISVFLAAVGLAAFTRMQGGAIAALTHTFGTLVEVIYIAIVVQPVKREKYGQDIPQPEIEPLRMGYLFRFHLPLYASSMLFFFNQPLVAAALARSPQPTLALAAWPVLNGLLSVVRSPITAFPEATIGLLDRQGSRKALQKFALFLSGGTILVFLAMVYTPLREVYFGWMLNIPDELLTLALSGAAWAMLICLTGPYDAYLRGVVTSSGQTFINTMATAGSLLAMAVMLGVGVWLKWPGIPMGAIALAASYAADLAVLWFMVRRMEKQGEK